MLTRRSFGQLVWSFENISKGKKCCLYEELLRTFLLKLHVGIELIVRVMEVSALQICLLPDCF